MTLLRYIGNFQPQNLGPPLDQILDPHLRLGVPLVELMHQILSCLHLSRVLSPCSYKTKVEISSAGILLLLHQRQYAQEHLEYYEDLLELVFSMEHTI